MTTVNYLQFELALVRVQTGDIVEIRLLRFSTKKYVGRIASAVLQTEPGTIIGTFCCESFDGRLNSEVISRQPKYTFID